MTENIQNTAPALTTPEPAPEAAPTLPEKFKTVSGKLIQVVGDRTKSALMINYCTSKLQGSLLLNGKFDTTPEFLSEVNALDASDALRDDRGNELVLLPIDAIALESGFRGLIVDTDLCNSHNGWSWLLDPVEDPSWRGSTLSNAINALLQLVGTVQALWDRGYLLNAQDGRCLYFSAEYGTSHLVYDGSSVIKADEWTGDPTAAVNKALSSIIIRELTGAWPQVDASSLIELPENAGRLLPDSNTGDAAGPAPAVRAWEALPLSLRQAVAAECGQDGPGLTPEHWFSLLEEAQTSLDVCVSCGAPAFPTAKRCFFCESLLSQEGVKTTWNVESSVSRYGLTFGRGTDIYGCTVSPSLDKVPFMKLMYNRKNNSLGLRNLSGFTWSWTGAVDGTSGTVTPGQVLALKRGLSIEFDGVRDLRLSFLDYVLQVAR